METVYLFLKHSMIASVVVNIGYYGIMNLVFHTNITVLCILFGGGRIVDTIFSSCLFYNEKKK